MSGSYIVSPASRARVECSPTLVPGQTEQHSGLCRKLCGFGPESRSPCPRLRNSTDRPLGHDPICSMRRCALPSLDPPAAATAPRRTGLSERDRSDAERRRRPVDRAPVIARHSARNGGPDVAHKQGAGKELREVVRQPQTTPSWNSHSNAARLTVNRNAHFAIAGTY